MWWTWCGIKIRKCRAIRFAWYFLGLMEARSKATIDAVFRQKHTVGWLHDICQSLMEQTGPIIKASDHINFRESISNVDKLLHFFRYILSIMGIMMFTGYLIYRHFSRLLWFDHRIRILFPWYMEHSLSLVLQNEFPFQFFPHQLMFVANLVSLPHYIIGIFLFF